MLEDVGQDGIEAELKPPTPPAKKARVWTVFLAVVLATVVNVGVSVLVVVLILANMALQGTSLPKAAEKLPSILMTPIVFVGFIVVGGLACGLGAVIPAWLSPHPVRQRLGLAGPRIPGSVYLLAMVGSIVPLAIALGFAEGLALIVPPDEALQLLFDRMSLATAVLFVLGIAIIPGVTEELLFRGYVQQRLLQRWTPAWAIGVTSLLFALVHVQPHTVVAAFPLGLWLGYLAWKCGSIGPSIVCHAFINGSLNAWRAVIKFGEVPESAQHVVEVASVVVGLVCVVLLFRRFAIMGKEPAETPAEVAGAADEGGSEAVIG